MIVVDHGRYDHRWTVKVQLVPAFLVVFFLALGTTLGGRAAWALANATFGRW